MDDLTLRKTIAENLTYYRRAHGLTQAALAATLNYSDKSVSKWERGEGLPDVSVLVMLAEYYGITVNDLVTPRPELSEEAEEGVESLASAEEAEDAAKEKRVFSLRTRILVPVLSIGLLWLAATIAVFLIKVICPDFAYSHFLFLYAVPGSLIVATVFACLWWTHLLRFICVSGIIWSVATCLYLTFAVPYISLIFAVAGVLQVLTVLWFIQIRK
ncbi:MAG: helix-turn-helix transcriptional regulator [Clostridia bacterium]|nr:helix-turn-helix transcriptional regulator [Clostridia bacterium]